MNIFIYSSIYVYIFKYLLPADLSPPSLAARYLEKKIRRFFDCFRAPPPSCFPGFTRGSPDD